MDVAIYALAAQADKSVWNRPALRARGVETAFRSHRIKVVRGELQD
ncbi:MAG: hypothetical protein AB7P17_06805 [Nitrospirales bacterium]|nr:hypothetical protein [Nitrospirales bacterium]